MSEFAAGMPVVARLNEDAEMERLPMMRFKELEVDEHRYYRFLLSLPWPERERRGFDPRCFIFVPR